MQVHKKTIYLINNPFQIIGGMAVIRNIILRFIQCHHVKLQPCSLSDGLISTAKSLRCMEGKQACGLGERANRQTSDSIAHIVAGMNKKAITAFSGLNTVLPCILTTCSTSREISHVMITSIALRDYSDHCLKSLNCNSTQQSSAAGKKDHPIWQGKVYLLPFVQFGKRVCVCLHLLKLFRC